MEAFGFELLMTHIQKTSAGLRSMIALLFLFPAGFLMGLPFPLGMCYILHTPAQRAYVWSVNGCASVLASIAAAQAALSLGIPYVVVFAILAYLLAFFVAGESSGSGFKLT
jgi:ABC-type multidrug transport system permease subunit